MNSYTSFLAQNQITVIQDTSQENKTKIEMSKNSEFFQELFLTKKEKNNNRIYNLLLFGGVIISILASLIPYILLDNNSGNNLDLYKTNLEVFTDMFKDISGKLFKGCIFFTTLIILVLISTPLYIFLEKKLVTKIESIKLTFSSNGLEIYPNKSNKTPIFIENLNISEICIKENEILETNERTSYKKRFLNIILKLHKPIINQLTKKDINEIILFENIDKDYLEEVIKFTKDIQQSIGIVN